MTEASYSPGPMTITNTVEFPYTRTLGPVLSRFFSALAEERILGLRVGARVVVPPLEYDPETGDDAGNAFVEVGPAGTVTSWTWVPEPHANHPLDHPFAFALIRLDGADTALFHAVDAGTIDAIRTGARVTPRWRAERRGRIDDIECFVPVADDTPVAGARDIDASGDPAVTTMDFFSRLTYQEQVAPTTKRYTDALLDARIIGQKCPTCGRTYVSPRGYCPVDALELGPEHDVTLTQRGTITNFTVITPVQYHGQKETEPFVRASVLLDDCDALYVLQNIIGIPSGEVRVGLRVEAQWFPPDERNVDEIENRGWGNSTGCIEGWRPTGEPDVPAEQLEDRVF